ncbi:MAG: hypothetical protein QGH33_06110 [Pirellulaceae bacterium]|nr:hypothetical protein [Pirellulaceae bacterium]
MKASMLIMRHERDQERIIPKDGEGREKSDPLNVVIRSAPGVSAVGGAQHGSFQTDARNVEITVATASDVTAQTATSNSRQQLNAFGRQIARSAVLHEHNAVAIGGGAQIHMVCSLCPVGRQFADTDQQQGGRNRYDRVIPHGLTPALTDISQMAFSLVRFRVFMPLA